MGKARAITVAALLTAALTACGGPEYANELTGTMLSEEQKDNRPVALTAAQDSTPPAEGIFYEYRMKDGIRRLVIIKDWGKIEETSLTESNQTAQQIAAEWDAVLVSSSPVPVKLPYVDEVSLNPASGEGIKEIFTDSSIPATYHDFHSVKTRKSVLSNGPGALPGAVNCESLSDSLGNLSYDSKKKVYKDTAGGEYTNVIIQNVIYLDQDGSDYYNLSDMNREGWLINSGVAVPLTWVKKNDIDSTHYFNMDGEEVTPPEGSTLIQLIGDADWESIAIR